MITKKGHLKIGTYNILTAGINRCGDRRNLILEVLGEINTQNIGGIVYPIGVLVLQEANGFDSENEPFMTRIKEELGFEHAVVSNAVAGEDGLRYNTIIYSRWPLKLERDFYPQLSVAGLCASIETEEFGEIGILSQHLYINTPEPGEDKRLRELDITLSFMERFKKQIVMGDFNAISEDDPYVKEFMDRVVEIDFRVMTRCKKLGYIDSIAQVLNGATLEDLRTYPTLLNENPLFKNPIRIDHILLKGFKEYLIKAGIHRSKAADKASDHYPVWTIIERK